MCEQNPRFSYNKKKLVGVNTPFKKIGSGSYGDVSFYPSKNIVVKQIHNHNNKSPVYIDQTFIREVVALSILQGEPNIIELKGYDPFTKEIFLTASSMTLSKLLKQENLCPIQECYIAQQIHIGLISIHSHNIWHRDIKPDNILVSYTNGKISIADFGLSIGAPFTWIAHSNPVYALSYRPPEVLRRREYDGVKGDIFALGIVFWDILTSRFKPSPLQYRLRESTEYEQLKCFEKPLANKASLNPPLKD